MPLPEPSADQQRELLGRIWCFATAYLHWPEANDLQPSPADEALGDIPPEFVRLIERREDFAPTRQELALTVAGVAACDHGHPVLAAFLDFLTEGSAVWQCEYRARSLRSNPEPGQLIPFDIGAITFGYLPSFAALMERVERDSSAPGSTLDNIYIRDDDDVDSPDAREAALAQRAKSVLMLLITVETAGWAIIDGRSTESFDQAFFKRFAGVTGLDDYWERRFKPWTTPSLPEAVHQQISTRPDTYNRVRLFKAQSSLLDDLLLELVSTAARGQPNTFVLCPPPEYAIDTPDIIAALERLESRRLAFRPTVDPAPDLPTVALTQDGAAHVRANREAWEGLALRNRQARDALLAWLYGQQDHPQYFVHVQRFLSDPRSLVSGRFFSPADVDGAASYLLEKQLIRGTAVDQTNAPAMARITSRGIDCVEEGGSVSDYVKKQPVAGGGGYTFNAPITARNFAAGDHAHQVAMSQGMSGSELRGLMQAVIEALPGLELQPAYASEVTTITAEVLTETEDTPRDHAKLRVALERLRTLLAMSGKTALAAALTALIDGAFTKLGLPPGTGG